MLSIVFGSAQEFAARCATAPVIPAAGRPGYEDQALIPGTWKPLSTTEAEGLRRAPNAPAALTVELVKFPAGFTRAQCPDREGPTTLPFFGGLPADYKNWWCSEPGEATSTVNWTTQNRIGIHLDNWEKHPYRTRLQSRRRLALNLGPGPRYVLLGMTDALEMCRGLFNDYEEVYPHTSHIQAYTAKVGLDCLRIRLDPGEGYVVPTELLPHDGSTEGLPLCSTAAFWLGDWPIGAFPGI